MGRCALTCGQASAQHVHMKVALRHHYAAAPGDVFAMMTSPDLVLAKCRAAGQHNVKIVELSQCAGIVSLRVRSDVVMDVPVAAQRFLGPAVIWEQHEEWDPTLSSVARTGIWQIAATGVPLTTGGTIRLTSAQGLRSVIDMNGEVLCPMPVVGAQLEACFTAEVERSMMAQAAFVDQYISTTQQHPPRC